MQQLEGRQPPPASGQLPLGAQAAAASAAATGEDDAQSVMSGLGAEALDDLAQLEQLETEALLALEGEDDDDSEEEEEGAGLQKRASSSQGMTRNRRAGVHLTPQALQAMGYGLG
jgi:hypothetical protein